jgi:DNA sulfur modification protein DndC
MDMDIKTLIERGALFVVNHSGGKDSQAMFAYIKSLVPADQIVVVHAVLPEVEWDGVLEHIKATIGDTPLYLCQARRTLLQMIEERGMFPSPSQRQCTSDLKRGPIEKTIRHLVKARAAAGHPAAGLVVNCMGMRAEESSSRSKLEYFKLNAGNSKAGREWWDWLPIHQWTVDDVWRQIKAAGQEGHWAYAAGMSRLSCCFCIMSNKADLTTAAKLNPQLYARYVALEKSTGQVMLMPSKRGGRLSLEQVTGVPAAA